MSLKIEPAKGKLGVLTPGLGAVATTFMAGVEAIRKALHPPIGSLTQMGTIRLGKRTDNRVPMIRDFVPLARVDDLVLGGWDIFEDNAYDAAIKAQVISPDLLQKVRPALKKVRPMAAVFDRRFVARLDGPGPNVKSKGSLRDKSDALAADIEAFKREHKCDRLVMVWCGSSEIPSEPGRVHMDLRSFEDGLATNDPGIAPSQVYAYAALMAGVPYANGAPNLTLDIPALLKLARDRSVPICGKDFKTGQTFLKTALAPALKARLLGCSGWFSTNMVGSREGEALDGADSPRTNGLLNVLDLILQPNLYPQLYSDLYHTVKSNYYPQRGDAKQGWDNIDLFGWLGYPMQIKIDFQCRDSILAAPLVLDLVLFLDLAQRAGLKGIQEWLSFYFKSPMTAPGLYPEHDIFIQLMKLKNTLRWMKGEALITHLGQEYYD
jgi:myo-inositol-1-phosphate synthase